MSLYKYITYIKGVLGLGGGGGGSRSASFFNLLFLSRFTLNNRSAPFLLYSSCLVLLLASSLLSLFILLVLSHLNLSNCSAPLLPTLFLSRLKLQPSLSEKVIVDGHGVKAKEN